MKKHELPESFQKDLIESLTDLSHNDQQDIMFEYGCQYLEKRTASKRYYLLMSGSKKVWQWWVMQWNKRTSNLIYELQLDEYTAIPPQEEMERIKRHYMDIHNVDNLIIRPSRVLLEESWKEMMESPANDIKKPSKITI